MKYLVNFNENSYLGRKCVDAAVSNEFGYVSNFDKAAFFENIDDAKSTWGKNRDFLIQKHNVKPDSVQFLKIPYDGLPLEDGEIDIYTGFFNRDDISSMLENEYKFWDRYAIKEITPKEALSRLADFVPEPELGKNTLSLYFWDSFKDGLYAPSGGFYNGAFSPMHGYDYKTNMFITENLVDCLYIKEHAGSWRLVDSGHRLPIIIDGKVHWVNVSYMVDWVKNGNGKIEDVNPAFKTSLDIDNFMEELDKGLREKF